MREEVAGSEREHTEEHEEREHGRVAEPVGDRLSPAAQHVADRLDALVGVMMGEERPEPRAGAHLELGEVVVMDGPERLRAPSRRTDPAEVEEPPPPHAEFGEGHAAAAA